MKISTRLSFLVFSLTGFAHGSQLIVNGGFETGSFLNWTVTNQAGGTGTFFVSNSTTTPLSSSATVGSESGTYYAVSDSLGPGTHILSQNFTVSGPVSSVVLSFGMFVDSPGGTSINPAGLDFTAIPDQYASVDILSSSASLFTTTTGDLRNFYAGTDSLIKSPYKNYSFDITTLVGAGGTFVLRFAEVNNVDYLSMGIDNVSIVTTVPTTAPEPSTLLSMSASAGALLLLKRLGASSLRRILR